MKTTRYLPSAIGYWLSLSARSRSGVGQAFQPAGLPGFPARHGSSGDWKVAGTGGLESLPYIILRSAGLLVLLLILTAPGYICPALADRATSIEQGRDVGDGQVHYDIPYDPKHVKAINFVSPTVRHPLYEIVVPMGDWTNGTSATLQKVRVNGVDSDSFYLFVDGFAHVQSGWITQKSSTARNVVLVTRSLWHNSEPVAIEVEIAAPDETDSSRTIRKSYTARAPAAGGGPEGWRRYQSVVLSEPAGLARDHEPVEFSLTVRAEDCADLERELRLYACDSHAHKLTPLPVQTFNARHFDGTPPGTTNVNYLQHPSRSLEGVFLASVPAHGAQVYLFVYDNPAAATAETPPTDLAVNGPPLGASVENQFYVVRLDPKCGQVASFELKGRKAKACPSPEQFAHLCRALEPRLLFRQWPLGPHLRVGSPRAHRGDHARAIDVPRYEQRPHAREHAAGPCLRDLLVLCPHPVCPSGHDHPSA